MSYVFRGRLCGYICDDCPEPFANMKVRVYRVAKDRDAATRPKDSFAILSEREVEAKRSLLLGEFDTNAEGEFVATLERQYEGEAFEVDVYCGTVPGRKPTPKPPKPLQFSVAIVQPSWQSTQRGVSEASWSYCLSKRYWCLVRARFHAWVICGRVTICDSRSGVAPNVVVKAFDADWLQHDALGSATTGSDGRFRIDYLPSDFRKDIFGLNIELFGGPDLYFAIETPSGTPLLTETPADGRKPGRENVDNCACVELCVKEVPPVTQAWFTRIGDFSIYSDIDYDGDGKTEHAVPFGFANQHAGPDYGFFGHMKLIGDCPTTHPATGAPLRYRFRYEVQGSGTGLQPIESPHMNTVLVGNRPILWDVFGTGIFTLRPQPIYLTPGGPLTPAPVPPAGVGPIPPVVIGPDAEGWVQVPPDATNQGFSGPLVLFKSETVVPGGAAPGNGAGEEVTDKKNGTKIRLVFEAEPVTGGSSTLTLTNELPNLYINNWSDVNQLEITQQQLPGATLCSKLSDELGIEYSTDHELMLAWSLGIGSSATIPPPVPVLPSGPTAADPRGDHGTVNVDIEDWVPCAYVVTLSTVRKLTNGEQEDQGHSSQLIFCKG
jgi:hypothetical protein